ncbi:serine hydrolase [Nocardia sp. 348MFTsu5.1]|uniref:serine hydrolase domain-containing protein n=1 Tax=Nocardia sp. 348MFTsu5.1 TaxID=1172185 RepID=UPI00037D8BEE|nr:serine hydrolase domain-containing protein [Nocardia sp. 348MFTsu5.1]
MGVMLKQLDSWPVGAVSAAVVSDGQVIETSGDTDQVFALASVTKLLAAHAVLVAIEEGAIELDQPAGPPGATVRHLLAHASGLDFGSLEIVAGPGEQRVYSSAGFEVLAELIGTEADIVFDEYLAQAVCEPLGMTSTALQGSAGHGAHSTVADLAAFAGELLAPALVSTELFAEATSVQFPGLDGFVPGYGKHRPCDWGLGYEIRSHKNPHWTGSRNSPGTFGHFGQSGTFLWVDPALSAACVVLTDRPFGAWAKPLWSEFNDSIVEALSR